MAAVTTLGTRLVLDKLADIAAVHTADLAIAIERLRVADDAQLERWAQDLSLLDE